MGARTLRPSFEPGHKAFDFDINEVSYTSARAKAVTFSNSYYDVQQSIVALKTKHREEPLPGQFKTYSTATRSARPGSPTSTRTSSPRSPPHIYDTSDEAASALKTVQIDAIVIDTPDGQYMVAGRQITNAKRKIATQVGQFPSVGEHYGLLFTKGNNWSAA